jgi:hypothetical protein
MPLSRIRSLLLADALAEALTELADIRCDRLGGAPARVTLASRPVVVVDLDASPEARCFDLLNAALVVLFGPDCVEGARTVRRFRPVG